ncbi:MAG: DMT family transporter [Bacteroidetes bacterium]|nr:DMT family transporter [Bacteroidota bacterium]
MKNKISRVSHYKAELLLLSITVFWGISFPFTKFALEDFSPIALVFLRFSITVVVFFAIYYKKLQIRGFKQWRYGFILGFLLFLGFISQTTGMKYTTASNSAFITGTNVLLVPFALYFVSGRKPKIQNIIGIIIVTVGLYYLTGIGVSGLNYGDFITIFCTFSFALHIVLLDKYSKITDIIHLVFGQFLAMAVLSFVYMMVMEYFVYDNLKMNFTTSSTSLVLFLALFGTLLVFFLMTKFQGMTNPIKASIIYNMEQVFATFFAYFLLDERLTFSQIIGALIMISGLIVSEFSDLIFKRKLK